jgi:DNA segregation ATPase FtsK/SpoIIIE, S-DNA-T family
VNVPTAPSTMRLVVGHGAGARDVVVSGLEPGTTVAALVTALGVDHDRSHRLLVDDRPVELHATITAAGVVDGSVVHTRATDPSAAHVVELATGPRAGATAALPASGGVVGRDDDADVVVAHPATSRRHARLVPGDPPTAVDLGSRNGTAVLGDLVETAAVPPGALVHVGRVAMRVRDGLALPPAIGPHLRPPRPADPAPTTPLPVPAAPEVPTPASPFPVTAALAPLVGSVVLAVLVDPRMAWFAVLGPLLAVGTWGEDRRRHHRARRRHREATARSLSELAAGAAAASAAERARRLAAHPDLGELAHRCRGGHPRLWERRLAPGDHVTLVIGYADQRWSPVEPTAGRTDALSRAAQQLGHEHGLLTDAPVVVVPTPTRGLGIVGPPVDAERVARALVVQAAALHGPADLVLDVAVDEVHAWSWAAWLPHVGPSGFGAAAERPPSASCGIVVAEAHRAVAVAAGWSVVVVAPSERLLPAQCTTVLALDDGAVNARLVDHATGSSIPDVLPTGCDREVARACARSLGRLRDPERVDGGDLPQAVRLHDVLEHPVADAAALAARWAQAGPAAAPRTTLGVGPSGPLVVDLAVDGPHALVIGTTGAGKSELLRTLVAGLAASSPPEACSLLLVDFKGGSAFDACAALPHVVGVVTDLDEHLAARVLRSLDAEIRHRERTLRDAGAPDLGTYQRSPRGATSSLARLVVVVDELATLVAELPDFVHALVDVARRGRSLGVHLVLATQRPQGCIDDTIRANADLRIALRVHDGADSRELLGDPIAACIDRGAPGRAVVRRGGELVAFQTALASAPATPAGLVVRDLVEPAAPGPAPRSIGGPSELDALVASAVSVAAARGLPAPRRPWVDPLPATLHLHAAAAHDLGAAAGGDGGPLDVVVGLVDDPDRQCHHPLAWAPTTSLLVHGIPGSGATTTLHSVVLAVSAAHSPADVHLHLVDHDGGGLAPLAPLPHVGGHVVAGDRERAARLVRRLRDDLARRQHGSGGPWPTVVLVVDDLPALLAAFDDADGWDVRDDLLRVLTDGPGVGMVAVASARHPDLVPTAVAATAGARWCLTVADPHAPARRTTPLLPGRGHDLACGLELQIAAVTDVAATVDAVREQWSHVEARHLPAGVGAMPRELDLSVVLAAVSGAPTLRADGRWALPLGVGMSELSVVGLLLGEGDHALVAGPPRSGRSSTLAAIASAAARTRPGVAVVEIRGRGQTDPHHQEGMATVASIVREPRPALVLVDDADDLDDADGVLAELCALRVAGLHVVAAGRADALRHAHGHWTRAVRRARTGLLLRPVVETDGDLLGVSLPRRTACRTGPGRGFLVVDGELELVQVGRPGAGPRPEARSDDEVAA